MYNRIGKILSHLSVEGKVLSISGRGPIVDMFNSRMSQVVESDYPEVDFQSLPYEDGGFDVVVSDQVLEHVVDPSKAVEESLRVVRPGGLVVHTTCFLNPIHLFPIDLWRFSPEALVRMVGNAEIIEAESWGNRSALLLMLMEVGHHLVPQHPNHPLHRIALYNDSRYPIVTWLIARKSDSILAT
jgi:SAM-dependent methyltransferase